MVCLLSMKINPQQLAYLLSKSDNDCAYHMTMATKINTPWIFFPIKNTKINPRNLIHVWH